MTVQLSPIVAGLWRLNEWPNDPASIHSFISQCVELGVTSFDHADIYGNYQCQQLFGRALKQLTHKQREEIQIVSKCGICLKTDKKPEHKVKHYNTGKQHIIASCEQSLKELQTDYLDLLLIHRPDPLMNALDVAEAFSELKAQGKIKAAGVSNFLPHQIDLLRSHGEITIATNQVELNLFNPRVLFDGTLEDAQKNKMPLMIWSPLAGGKLFGSELPELSEMLNQLAEKYQTSVDTLCYAWFNLLPVKLHPITGSGKIERIKAAVDAQHLQLDRQDWYLILEKAMGNALP